MDSCNVASRQASMNNSSSSSRHWTQQQQAAIDKAVCNILFLNKAMYILTPGIVYQLKDVNLVTGQLAPPPGSEWQQQQQQQAAAVQQQRCISAAVRVRVATAAASSKSLVLWCLQAWSIVKQRKQRRMLSLTAHATCGLWQRSLWAA
jgi:hypothetical protein